MAGNTVEIVINAKGNANQEIQKVSGSLGSLAKAVGSPLSAVGNLVTKFGMFGIGVQGVQTLARGIGELGSSLLSGNNAMEQASARIQAFTKDAGMTQSILAAVRKEADTTPFAFNEMAAATGGLMSAAKQANEPLMDLLKTAEILAASNPAEGLEGAAFALREAVSGDFTSIIERFNLPRVYINQLKAEGVPALEAVRKAMLSMGFDTDLVANMAQTAQGRWSTFVDTFNRYKDIITQPIFDLWKEGLALVQGWLDANSAKLEEWAIRGAASISLILGYVKELAPAFSTALMSTLGVVWSVGQLIYEALSYLNPFATHSPSLVSQVESGINLIMAKYGSLAGITGPLNTAKGAILSFAQTADAGMIAYTQHVTDAQIKTLQTFGADMPQAYAEAQAAMVGVEAEIYNLNMAIIAQSQVVQQHRAAIAALDDDLYALQEQLYEAQLAMGDSGGGGFAGATIDTAAMLEPFQLAVEKAQEVLQGLQGELSAAKGELDKFTGMNIQGTKAFTDQMFALDQQIKRAQLNLLNLKTGGGTKKDIEAAEKALQALRIEQEKLKLGEELRTDPLKKQIQDLAKPMQELPFGDIIKGIKESQSKIDTLTPAIALQETVLKSAQTTLKEQTKSIQEMARAMGGAASAASANTEAIKALQAAIHAKEKERREAQKDLEPEAAALSDLETQRGTLQEVLNDWDRFLGDVIGKANQWEGILDAAAKKAAAAGGLPGAGGGLGLPGGDLESMGTKVKEITDQLKTDLNFDETIAGWKANMETFSASTAGLKDSIDKLVTAIDNWQNKGGEATEKTNAFAASLDPLRGVIAQILSPFEKLVQRIQDFNGGGGVAGPGTGITGALKALGNFAAMVASVQFAPLILGLETLLGFWRGMVFGIEMILAAWNSLADRWAKGDWWGVVVEGIGLIFTAVVAWLMPVIAALDAFVRSFVDIISNLVTSVIGFFQGLFDALIGKSIIPDLVNGILKWFGDLWTKIQAPFNSIKNFLIGEDGKSGLWGSISTGIEGIATGIKGIILGMVNASIRGINALLNMLRSVKLEIPKLVVMGAELFPGASLGFNVPPNLPEIPALAEGGVVLKPTMALLGERGRETVLPLDPDEFAAKVGVEVAKALRRYPQISNTFNNADPAVQSSWQIQSALSGV